MRIITRLLLLPLTLLMHQGAEAVVYTWEMDADEQQVNNCALPVCDPDGSTDSMATGSATLVYDTTTGEIGWDIAWADMNHLLSAIHIHGPATPDVSNGAHIFDVFPMIPDVLAAGVDRTTDSHQDTVSLAAIVAATGTFSQDPLTLLEVLTDEHAYVNYHSCDVALPCPDDGGFPAGEIRANLDLVGYELGPGETVTAQHGRCSLAVHDKVRKASRAAASFNERCNRKLARGADPASCGSLDAKLDKLGAQHEKRYEKRCTGLDDDLVLHRPPFGAPEPDGAAGVVPLAGALIGLADSDLLDGDAPLDAAADPDASRCQLEGLKRMHRCADAHTRELRSCKKTGFAGGSAAKLPPGTHTPFAEPADLDGCLGFDPKQRIEKACVDQIERAVARTCEGVPPATAFPGGNTGDPAADLRQVGRCLACLTHQRIDRLGLDCDAYDEGDGANDSCGT